MRPTWVVMATLVAVFGLGIEPCKAQQMGYVPTAPVPQSGIAPTIDPAAHPLWIAQADGATTRPEEQHTLTEPAPGAAVATDSHHDPGTIRYETSCQFDAYEHFHDTCARRKHLPFWKKKKIHAYLASCENGDVCDPTCAPVMDCDPCGLDGGRRHWLKGWHRGGCGSCGGLFGKCGVCSDNPACTDFTCADCYSRFNFEKRLVYSYTAGNPLRTGTRMAYDNSHAGQVGAEMLPWVIVDGSDIFLRWGFTAMFNYIRYQGNREVTLISRQTGRVLTPQWGETWGFVVGPTFRADIEPCGLFKISPNATFGMAFDWTDMEISAPVGTTIHRLDYFKMTGFDVGAYIRLMLDIPITETINFGIGGDFRFTPSNVLLQDDGQRKHLGVVIAFSHEF